MVARAGGDHVWEQGIEVAQGRSWEEVDLPLPLPYFAEPFVLLRRSDRSALLLVVQIVRLLFGAVLLLFKGCPHPLRHERLSSTRSPPPQNPRPPSQLSTISESVRRVK